MRCVCVRVCAHVRTRVCMCVRVCTRARTYTSKEARHTPVASSHTCTILSVPTDTTALSSVVRQSACTLPLWPVYFTSCGGSIAASPPPPPQDVTHLAQSYGWEGIVQNWGRTCAYDWLAKAKSPGSCAAPLRLRHGNSYFPPSTDERWGIAIDIVSIFRSLTLLASADRAFRFAGFH